MRELQPVLDQLASSRPGAEQMATHDGVTRFRSHGGFRHGGWIYVVEDYANGKLVPLGSPVANERRFVMPNRSYWRYRFPFTEPPLVNPSALERQLAASEYVNIDGHGIDPR